MSPTALTLRHLRTAGYLADVVERWIAQAGIRKDLFGIIDLIGITLEPVLGIQCTSLSNVASRLAKARSLPALGVWLSTGARFQVFGWAKRQGRWHAKILELQRGDLEAVVLAKPPRNRRKARHESADLFAGLEAAGRWGLEAGAEID